MPSLLRFTGILALLGLVACAKLPADPAASPKIRITLVGDSTQTEKQGYGTGFCANLVNVDCVNRAKGGASTKTYRRDGLWATAQFPKPDWMLIQFGHNDVQSASHGDRETDLATEYPANLRRYIEEARATGIKPVLVTPIARRYFQADGKIVDDLPGHVAAMKKVAAEMNVPLIDLHEISQRYFEQLGEIEAHKLGPTKAGPNGTTVPDKTHFNQQGSYVLGRMVVEAMGRTAPELSPYIRPLAAKP
ncbi:MULTISPECIES: rhamnogalacturonan acetylesterase [unclassified Uliginosibacterium]|uniref:rhamnogalacturonan acetylesterase n=1 Tax=unclassified Uliginosibacterium TaxID=2621521 RepID=UPI000C7D4887|nr:MULTISPECIES: rhamnogalacturonan acetylesterase [unclassified Uliginosibacterium]MDO6385249.1 rhamnogalacturonan acetylesterase [Uliginosibacterium sp. 31-12]PLK47737.1 lysophospholipase [Uliginosibacterium sp. TH139]